MGHSGLVWSALLPAVLGQRVTGEEAHREYHAVVRAHGEPAPGPVESWVPPPPEVVAGLRYRISTRLGVERARASTVIEAARRMGRLGEIIPARLPGWLPAAGRGAGHRPVDRRNRHGSGLR